MNLKQKLWSAFLIFLLLLTMYTTINEIASHGMLGFSSIVKLFLQIIGAIGLYGFIANKKIMSENFWRIFFNLNFGFFAIMILFVILNSTTKTTPQISFIYYIAFVLLYGLYFYGLFRYAYLSEKIWNTSTLKK